MFNYGLCLKTSITLIGKYLHVFLFKKWIKLWKLIFVENVFIVDDKEIMFWLQNSVLQITFEDFY